MVFKNLKFSKLLRAKDSFIITIYKILSPGFSIKGPVNNFVSIHSVKFRNGGRASSLIRDTKDFIFHVINKSYAAKFSASPRLPVRCYFGVCHRILLSGHEVQGPVVQP